MDSEIQKAVLETWGDFVCYLNIFPEITKSIEGIAISQGLQITLSGSLAIYKICIFPKEGFSIAQICFSL